MKYKKNINIRKALRHFSFYIRNKYKLLIQISFKLIIFRQDITNTIINNFNNFL